MGWQELCAVGGARVARRARARVERKCRGRSGLARKTRWGPARDWNPGVQLADRAACAGQRKPGAEHVAGDGHPREMADQNLQNEQIPCSGGGQRQRLSSGRQCGTLATGAWPEVSQEAGGVGGWVEGARSLQRVVETGREAQPQRSQEALQEQLKARGQIPTHEERHAECDARVDQDQRP